MKSARLRVDDCLQVSRRFLEVRRVTWKARCLLIGPGKLASANFAALSCGSGTSILLVEQIMAQPEEDYGDRTTIFRRDDTLRSDEKMDIGHYLVVIAGVDLGHRLRVESEPVIIGRDAHCGLALSSPDVSRRHCRVARNRRSLFILSW